MGLRFRTIRLRNVILESLVFNGVIRGTPLPPCLLSLVAGFIWLAVIRVFERLLSLGAATAAAAG